MTSTIAVTVATPISVPTSQGWDSDGAGSWSTFIVDVGTPPQPSRVLVSTSGYETWVVVQAGCPAKYGSNCVDKRGKLFTPANSTSWTNIATFTLNLEANLGYTGNGQYGHDIVQLGYPGSGGPVLPNQNIAGIASPDFWLGIFGLDPAPSNYTTLNDPQPNFLWTLNNTNAIPSTSWAYTAGAPYRNNKVQGSLTFGGYDSSRFTTKNVTFPFYQDVGRRFIVGLNSITWIPNGVSTTTTSTTLTSDPLLMLIDSTVPYIYLPEAACAKFESAFGLQYNETSEIYTVNDTQHATLVATDPRFTFTLANTAGKTLDIVLPYSAFDLTASFPVTTNDTKYFPLKRAANDTQYTLGRSFLQEAYMIADFERDEFTIAPCAWPSTFEQNLVPILLPGQKSITNSGGANSTADPANKSTEHKTPIGPIVGGVVGGIAVLIAAICFYLFYWRKRHAKSQVTQDPSIPNETSAFTETANQDTSTQGMTELESKHYAELQEAGKLADHKYEMVGTPAGRGPNRQEMDTYVPVGSELGSTQVYEMPGESMRSEMDTGTSRVPSSVGDGSPGMQRSAGVVSPLSGTTMGGSPDERVGGRTYFNSRGGV